MYKPSRLFIILILCVQFASLFAQPLAIIPQPQKIIYKEGKLNFAAGLKYISLNSLEETNAIAKIFSQKTASLGIKENNSSPIVVLNLLKIKDQNLNEEGYHLQVKPDSILISANTHAGLFYGAQTLLQIISTSTSGTIPCLEIIDYPTYSYRGMHLDVARHFFSKEFIKEYIDQMAQYKLNVFHWHLTDDQGWRIEIKKYPKLTEVGGWRKEKDGSIYGGYYSQDDIREIVQYAKERYITIIPEIDMPGHFSAAIAAYPNLGCLNKPIAVPNTFGIKKDIFCPTDSSFYFLQNVLDEVCELFPGKYIHIGGDEVPKNQWEKNEMVQQLMQDKKLNNKNELQHYFMQRISSYLTSIGKKSIAWGEIIKVGLPDSIIVMSWRGKIAGIKAAKQKHPVIMSPRTYCYFDYPQRLTDPFHAIWMQPLPMKRVYRFEPKSHCLSADENNYILGGEAMLWTEFVLTEEKAKYQTFPRITAFSEAVWTQRQNKNYAELKKRLLLLTPQSNKK